MKFLSIVRYFSGCVSLKFEGVFIEKFLNLLIKNNIGFWNLTKSEISVSFCTNLKNYKTVVLLSEKCGLELCGTVEKGVPKIIRKYQKRYGIAAGILIFCAFIAASSRFIWKVEVSGNQTVPTSLILSAAEKYGVKAGALFSSVNALHAERGIITELNGISWITVNVQNCVVRIEISETKKQPKMYLSDDAVFDIVAKRDGVIKYIELYSGEIVRDTGSAAAKGDTVVSGKVTDKNGKSYYNHARAKIIAFTNHRITVEVPFLQSEKIYSDSIFKKSLNVFGIDVPLYLKKYKGASDTISSFETLNFLWFELPVKICEYEILPYSETKRKISGYAAKISAEKELQYKKDNELADAVIHSESIKEYITGECYIIVADYYCEEDIGEEKYIGPMPALSKLFISHKIQ